MRWELRRYKIDETVAYTHDWYTLRPNYSPHSLEPCHQPQPTDSRLSLQRFHFLEFYFLEMNRS